METRPRPATARVPLTVRCLDAQGRPVRLSARSLGRGSNDLQALLRSAYGAVRGVPAAEPVTVSFIEGEHGQLRLEYLALGAPPCRRRFGLRGRRTRRDGCEEVATALAQAALVVGEAVETIGVLTTAGSARWTAADTPEFVDLVRDDGLVRRVPAAVRTLVEDPQTLDLFRGALTLFVADDVERLIIGRDPETPGRYHEVVLIRSPELLRFLGGEPLSSLAGADPAP
ncbi:hypothetical protein ACSNO4_06055 [Kocuria flava]|uniref:hypothetical protein n=1 Tax=Kocuria flava TaxID=446860 RepID=UPI003F19FADA